MSILIAQAIGFVAFALGVTAFYQKDDRKLRMFLVWQGLVLAVHFFFLGAYTGAGMAVFAAIRALVSLFPWGKNVAPVFYVLIVILAAVTHQSYVDLLPAFAGIMGTTGLFYVTGLRMRLAFLTGNTAWLVHNILVGSIGPALMEGFMLSTLLFRIVRTLRHKPVDKTGDLSNAL